MTSIVKIVESIVNGEISAVDTCLQAIEKTEQIKDYNAVLSITKERALQRAKQIDESVAKGEAVGRLAGVPFLVKDNFLVFGAPTTAAAKLLEDFSAPMQATAVEKLESEGAICIGKTNLDAFAHGGSTENSYFGVTKNAMDKKKVAGGSSGGSAVATALDVVPFALGSDTGGSIRQPAAFNGVYGMKPTYGAVSRFGVVAMASSTDTIGCFARNTDDLRTVMEIMAGVDEKDMTTIGNVYNQPPKRPKKIGVIAETMTDGVDQSVRKAMNAQIEKWKRDGYIIEEVSMPMTEYSLGIYYIVVPAEISSNLARYDGVRYGTRAEGVTSLSELYGKTRDQGFMVENKRRIMIGSYVLSSGFYDAYYQQAQKARRLLIDEFNALFDSYDLLVSPTSPTTAFAIGLNADDPVKMYLADVMTVPASLAGLPAINAPIGTDEEGLPIGVQIIGPSRRDVDVVRFASTTEDKS